MIAGFFKNQKGFSLVEAGIAAVIASILAIGTSQLLMNTMGEGRKAEIIMNVMTYKEELKKVVEREAVWALTVGDNANGKFHNCLREANRIVEDCVDFAKELPAALDHPQLGHFLILRNIVKPSPTFLDSTNPQQGFTKTGQACNNFDPNNVNEACPFRAEAFWRFECPGRESDSDYCSDPLEVVSVRFLNISEKYGDINFQKMNFVYVRDHSRQMDVVNVVCDSTDGVYDPVNKICVKSVPDGQCPPGEFISGVLADGSILCSVTECNFRLSRSSVDEDAGNHLVYVNLSKTNSEPVSVDYSISGGTATRDLDFTLIDGTLNFAPGMVSLSIPVDIINENPILVEGNETFIMRLSNGVNCQPTAPMFHTVTIIDDDTSPGIYFERTIDNVTDVLASTINVPIRLGTASAVAVTVDVQLNGGSATPVDDYTTNPLPETINFAPGETLNSFVININSDALAEGLESVNFKLANAVGAAIDTSKDSYRLNIDDTQPTVAFRSSKTTVSEKAGNTSVRVDLSGPSVDTITVNYALVPAVSKALGGIDMTFTNGSLTFAPGETTKSFTFNPIDDGEADPDETFQIDLSGPVNALLGVPPSHVVTLTDSTPPAPIQVGCYMDTHACDGIKQNSCWTGGCGQRRVIVFSVGNLVRNALCVGNPPENNYFDDPNLYNITWTAPGCHNGGGVFCVVIDSVETIPLFGTITRTVTVVRKSDGVEVFKKTITARSEDYRVANSPASCPPKK